MYTGAPEIAFTCGDQCQWRLWTEGQPPTKAGQAAAPMQNYTRAAPLTPDFSAMIRRAYYAAVSLMDDRCVSLSGPGVQLSGSAKDSIRGTFSTLVRRHSVVLVLGYSYSVVLS